MSSEELFTHRLYKDGDHEQTDWQEEIFQASWSHKCPTYIHRTPPCQGSCPSGEDIRGWLQIVRGLEKPTGDMPWQEYAFRRSTDANPFPSMMGRVCPAPCQDGCNRNELEDFVGINSVEQFIGDYGLENNLSFDDIGEDTGKKVAIIGGGVGGLACAYQLRRMGHACTVFDEREFLGGMAFYGIPGYRTPRDVIGGEIQRILDMGVEVKTKTRVGQDVSFEQLEKDYDAIVLAIGAQSGRRLGIPGDEAPNVTTGVAFLAAFNEGRMQKTADKVVVIGGGDTAMDVVSVARRLGHITESHSNENERPEHVILNHTAQDVATTANRQGSHVTLAYRRPIDKMPAAEHEVHQVKKEGVDIRGSLAPKEVVLDDSGRAIALRVIEVDWSSGSMEEIEGSEFDIECDLVVGAVGQGGDMQGLEQFDNGRGLVDADKYYQVPGKEGYFAIGDIVRPHLLTTAIGHASVAADSIDHYLKNAEYGRRPKVDVHHFDLLGKLRESQLEPEQFEVKQDNGPRPIDQGLRGTADDKFAIHNYEDRSHQEVIAANELFLGHFDYTPRKIREFKDVSVDNVLGHFEEMNVGLQEEQAQQEAERCMSCGMCFECDNCVIYCPQDAVFRVKKNEATTGRYVDTDYTKCIGCHICADVCPTGYIDMGMGE
jgi:NADPH-dependent glutamate synthase beta subunit-like oxidoreductase